jgi:hypothetical protein
MIKRRGSFVLVDETQMVGAASLGLWWLRWEGDSGLEENLAYLLADEIADPDGGDVPCQQLYRMWPGPFSLLVRALAARPAAEGGRPPAGIDFEPLLADWAARSPAACSTGRS